MPDPHVPLLIEAWHNASADDLATGLGWYESARREAECIALSATNTNALTTNDVIGVIAALSPRVSWPLNIAAARTMVDAWDHGENQPIVPGIPSNRDKAWAILTEDARPLDILSGPKVRAFYCAIKGDPDAVVLDVWAMRAAGISSMRGMTTKQYERLSNSYRAAAAILGHTPRDVQSAIWVSYRRQYVSRSHPHDLKG